MSLSYLGLGDIFASNAAALTNPVNCVGVMGKGLALEFKRRFPAMFKRYQEWCQKGFVRLGEPHLYFDPMDPNVRKIINFPTKNHWRDASRLEDIAYGLGYLEASLPEWRDSWGATSLAVPALGCGEGGLRWDLVRPLLLRFAERAAVPVEVYEPVGGSLA